MSATRLRSVAIPVEVVGIEPVVVVLADSVGWRERDNYGGGVKVSIEWRNDVTGEPESGASVDLDPGSARALALGILNVLAESEEEYATVQRWRAEDAERGDHA